MNKVFVAKEKYPLLDESIQTRAKYRFAYRACKYVCKKFILERFQQFGAVFYLLTPTTKMISFVLMRQSVRFIIEGWCFRILTFVASKIVYSKRVC